MRRVLHVPMPLSTQGSTLITVARELVLASGKLGHESHVILSDDRDARVPEAKQHFVSYSAALPRQYFTKTEMLADALIGRVTDGRRPRQKRLYGPAVAAAQGIAPDVTLLYEGHYALPSIPAWKKALPGSDLVVYVHNKLSKSYGKRELHSWVSLADRVVFVAQHALDAARKSVAPELWDKMMVVPNGVGKSFLNQPTVDQMTQRSVAYYGQVSEGKGISVLLDAMEIVALETREPIELHIIGGSQYGYGELSEYEKALRERVLRMPSSITVEFSPHLPQRQLIERLRDVSILCFPSLLDEAFGLSVVEGMALGKAVIIADSPGMVEAAAGAALITRRGDAGNLAKALIRIFDDTDLQQKLAERGRARAQRLSWEASAKRLIAE